MAESGLRFQDRPLVALVRLHRGALARALVLALPVALGTALYYRYLGLWFWTDDFLWLEAAANPDLFDAFKGALIFPAGSTPYWRPLIDLHFFSMYRVFGLNAAAYHAVNLALHVSTAGLLGLLTLRLTRSAATASLAAGAFVVSPTYVAMVPWASGATAILSGFLSMLTMLLFVRAVQDKRGALALVPALLAFVAALLAKEDAAALPVVLALLAFVARPARTWDDARELTRYLMPFAVLWLAYTLPQLLIVVGSEETPRYSVDWHGVPRLVDALRWMSFPWPPSYAGWVSAAGWLALSALTLAALLSALRHAMLPLALYAATVALLLPSSFLTTPFAPRWTYHATMVWAPFVATLAAWLIERVGARSRPTAVAGAALAVGLLAVLYLRTLDAQDWVFDTSDEYQRVEQTITAQCGDVAPGGTIYIFPLPVPDPGYAVPSLVRLRWPGTRAYPMRPSALLRAPAPRAGSCALYWNRLQGYVAKPVPEGLEGLAFWSSPATPNLLFEQSRAWGGWRSGVHEGADGMVVASSEERYGAYIGQVPPIYGASYVGSVWIRAPDAGPGERVGLILRQGAGRQPFESSADFALGREWRQIAVYHTALRGELGALGLHVVRLNAKGASSFLVRDPQIKFFSVQPSPP